MSWIRWVRCVQHNEIRSVKNRFPFLQRGGRIVVFEISFRTLREQTSCFVLLWAIVPVDLEERIKKSPAVLLGVAVRTLALPSACS